MSGYGQGGHEQAWHQPHPAVRVLGNRSGQAVFLPVFVGLLIGSLFLPFVWQFLRQSEHIGRGGIVVFFVPLAAGPLFMLGFQRPAFSLLLAIALGLLDWRLGGRFGLFGDVLGITANPTNIFFLLLFLQSFVWRSCRRVSRVFWLYVAVVFVGGALGMLVTADLDRSMSAFIMRLVIPAGIAVNAIRSLNSHEDLELVWLGVIFVALSASVYNMALGFSGESGFGRTALGGNAFSIACACLMPAAVGWGLEHPRALHRWTGRFASVMFMAQIWTQSSRTAITVAGLYVLVTIVLRFRRILLSPLYVALVATVALVGTGYYAQSRLAWSGSQKQVQRFADFIETGIRQSNRWEVWNEAVELIAANPMLGTGINAFTEASWLGYYGHPHQILLAMWLDTGPVGMLAYLVLMVYLGFATIRRTQRAPPGVVKRTCHAAMAMLLILFATMEIEGYLYCGKYMIGTWLFHFVVISAFVAIALADEHERQGLWERFGPGPGTM